MAQPGVRRRSTSLATEAAGGLAANIPDKLYFRIGEVANLCGLPAYVLRFWEREFPQLRPNKGGTGQRLYRRRDVLIVLRIKELLYKGGFTIPGARQMLSAEQRRHEPQLALAIVENEGAAKANGGALRGLRTEMRELLEMLGGPAAPAAGRVQPIRPSRVRQSPSNLTPDLFE